MRRLLFATTILVLGPGLAGAGTMTGDDAFSAGDYAAAYREWSQAAATGDVSAMAAVGTLYDTGLGVPQDFARALEWYRRSAEAGNVRAMFNVGVMYDNGRGTPVDRAEAIRWYERAAEQGNGRAGFAAGLIFRDGDGVPRDRSAAIHYFRIAAQSGIEAARANLAALHAAAPSRPVPAATSLARPARPDAPTLDAGQIAIARLQQAMLSRAPLDPAAAKVLSDMAATLESQAAKGGRIAQYDVGYALENGYGVARDPVRSYVYYLRATASPEQSIKAAALRGAAAVAKALTEAQHAQARDMLLDDAP